MPDLDTVKDRLDDLVDAHAAVLIEASHEIHAHPELGFEEHFAHDILTSVLTDAGVEVERSAYGLDTAFAARAGSTGPTIAVLCEYDALPVIGHACGHNVIGTAGLGAGIAAAALAEELGGQLLILGTPAEEGGGGKVMLAENGALEGVDAAMMVHPAGLDLPTFGAIAIQTLYVDYHGRAAHAAAAPQKGLNALDAAVLGYMNVAALRQHIRPDERIHGIFTAAGDAANVVPEHTAATWYVRSPKMSSLEALKARVLTCLEAGATAAGCSMEHHWHEPAYADLVDNDPFMALYAANAERVGRTLADPATTGGVVGSTDMGNVSHLVPSIHPMIKVSPANVPIHTADFATYAGGAEGDKAVIDGAKMLAATVADLWCQPAKLEEIKAAFEATDRQS